MKVKQAVLWLLALTLLAGCNSNRHDIWQGYVEGDSLMIAAPVAGTLRQVPVTEGQEVKPGEPLFSLSPDPQDAALAQARAELAASRSQLADLEKGKRPQELAVIKAQYQQARAAADLSAKQLKRTRELFRRKLTSRSALDQAQAANESDQRRVQEVAAQLRTAHLAARSDQIAAAKARVRAAQETVAQAQWQLQQKRQAAPARGMVQEVLYHAGEFVPAGQPVIRLLPPDRIKIRFFVPESVIAKLHPGDKVQVSCDGCGPPFSARVRYISPDAEYTPPFIYSRDNREKFVYLVEAWPDSGEATKLHPGQPVDVRPPGANP